MARTPAKRRRDTIRNILKRYLGHWVTKEALYKEFAARRSVQFPKGGGCSPTQFDHDLKVMVGMGLLDVSPNADKYKWLGQTGKKPTMAADGLPHLTPWLEKWGQLTPERRKKLIKQARTRAHELFDRIWWEKHMTRPEAYQWLSRRLGIESRDCHMSRFGLDDCDRVIQVSSQFLTKARSLRAKRKRHHKEKRRKQREAHAKEQKEDQAVPQRRSQ